MRLTSPFQHEGRKGETISGGEYVSGRTQAERRLRVGFVSEGWAKKIF